MSQFIAYLLVGGILLILLVSCQEKTPDLPLPEAKIVALLSDVHLAEAAMQNIPVVQKDSVAEVYYQQIYTIHGIDAATFDSLMILLNRQPATMHEIYQKVMDTLKKEKEAINKK